MMLNHVNVSSHAFKIADVTFPADVHVTFPCTPEKQGGITGNGTASVYR